MPFVHNAEAKVYWQSLGEGEPLVLVMGLGCSSAMWFRLAPELAKHYRVILIDNRGVGQTEVQFAVVHRVSSMASDIAAVLDAAGEESAHVLGISMGGMIAQEFAISYPRRLRSLVLAATNCGGAYAVMAEVKVWGLLFSKGSRSAEENLALMKPYTFARSTPQALIDEDHAMRLAHYPQLRGYQAQLYGLMRWSSYLRLPKINRPTLVMHGIEDQLIPPANSEIIAKQIPHAQLLLMKNASHWLTTDQLEQTLQAVRGFVGAGKVK